MSRRPTVAAWRQSILQQPNWGGIPTPRECEAALRARVEATATADAAAAATTAAPAADGEGGSAETVADDAAEDGGEPAATAATAATAAAARAKGAEAAAKDEARAAARAPWPRERWGPWRKGGEYYRIEGSVAARERQSAVNQFEKVRGFSLGDVAHQDLSPSTSQRGDQDSGLPPSTTQRDYQDQD